MQERSGWRQAAQGCLLVPVGLLVIVAWIGTVVTAVTLSAWALLWIAASVALTFVFRRLGGVLIRWHNEHAWDAEIRTVIARLPEGTRVRRSRAGQAGVAGTLAWIVLGIGLLGGAACLYISAASTEYDPDAVFTPIPAVVVVAVAGTIAGGLLAVARDGRRRRAGIGAAIGIPIAISLATILHSPNGPTSDLPLRILFALVVLLASGMPVVIGFFVVRWLVGHRSIPARQPVRSLSGTPLLPELEAATRHGEAIALIRDYCPDESGEALLAEDRAALDAAGYEAVAVCRWEAGPMSVVIASFFVDRAAAGSGVLEALFVRRGTPMAVSGASD